MKPIIGISGRPALDEDNDLVIAVMDTYRKAIILAGGIPLIIMPPQQIDYFNTPNKDINELTDEDKEILEQVINRCDGILVGGGLRILPYEKYIYEYATKINKPFLGICLGMQLIGYYQNKDYLISNETEFNHRQRDKKYCHEVKIDKSSKLYQIFKKDHIMVNSFHSKHINSIKGYKVVARSFDGLIEAIELENATFNMGVQWHPEAMTFYDEDNLKFMKAFIDACKSTSNVK